MPENNESLDSSTAEKDQVRTRLTLCTNLRSIEADARQCDKVETFHECDQEHWSQNNRSEISSEIIGIHESYEKMDMLVGLAEPQCRIQQRLIKIFEFIAKMNIPTYDLETSMSWRCREAWERSE